MVSKIDIWNIALNNMGSRKQIVSESEDGFVADQMRLRYDPVRLALLEHHPWNFAMKRVALALSANTPAFGFANAFVLPSDFVRMVATKEELDAIAVGSPEFNGYLTVGNFAQVTTVDNYVIEIDPTSGVRVLLSDDSSKKVAYVFDQEDTSKFSADFVELLGLALAAVTARRITDSDAEEARLKQELVDKLRESKTIDSQQGVFSPTEFSTFLLSRN